MSNGQSNGLPREGLGITRLLMVLSSMSPLFVLWAIRGNNLIPDRYSVSACVLLVIIPNAYLFFRIGTAVRRYDRRRLVIGISEDRREHLLVYLFAMLLPLYAAELHTVRDVIAVVVALAFV